MHVSGGAPSRLDRWYPWLIVFASLTMIVVGQGIQFVLSVSLKPMTADLGWPRQVPSLAYAASMVCAGIGALYLGRLSDRIGMGPVALIGAVMIPSGAVMTSFVTEPWQLYLVFGVMIGLFGNATIFAPLMANTTRWFDRNRGLALGIVASGQSMGGTIWPPIAPVLNVEIGWRGTFLWYGVAALVFGRDARAEKLAALAIALVMTVAGVHTLYDLWDKIANPRPIEFWTLGFAAVSMVLVGICVVAALFRVRRETKPVIKATWLSARNDSIATAGFAVVGLAARVAPVRWLEYLFDVLVACLCFQAAWAIWKNIRSQPASSSPAN